METSNGLGVVQPQSVSEQVYAMIRDAIVAKTLAPGSTVTEAQLAARLGVSKTPVREAFIRLREVGLLEAQQPRGIRVTAIDKESIDTAWETREILESATTGLAAKRASKSQTETIMKTAKKSLDAALNQDREGFRQADRELHSLIWKAANNTDLLRITENAYTLASALREMRERSAGFSELCARQHVKIASEIMERNAPAASQSMIDHIRSVRRG